VSRPAHGRNADGSPRPTILDVAERAGVSKSLVSLVLRDEPAVSDEKRAAVLAAADALGYRPNAAARSLVRRRSNLIGVMVSDLGNPFFIELVDGIEDGATAAGYRALVNTGRRESRGEREALETLLELRTDGVILAGSVLPTAAIEQAARSAPVVLLARPSRSRRVDSVTNDDRAGGEIAVDHLASLGHRAIAHIDGGAGSGAGARRRGYIAAMRRHGLQDHVRIARGSFTEGGGAQAVNALYADGARPTAIFVANDVAAVGALHALEQLGLQVPDDVSLVGYDNITLAALSHIGLTTIHQPRHDMGDAAVRLLVERLDHGRTPARHIVIRPTLVERTTSGPPPRGRPRAPRHH
jgi:DNA-binding LacI/PurR family transcriptional regulator